jgi:tetratricopeptide (TPR) repeat protein
VKFLLLVSGVFSLLSCSGQTIEHNKKQEFSEKIKNYDQKIQQNSQNPQFWYDRAIFKDSLNDYIGAVQDLNKVVILQENFSKAYFLRGLIKFKQEDYSGSINDFNKLLDLEPNNPKAYFQRGIIRLKVNDLTGACKEFQKAKTLGMKEAEEKIKEVCK